MHVDGGKFASVVPVQNAAAKEGGIAQFVEIDGVSVIGGEQILPVAVAIGPGGLSEQLAGNNVGAGDILLVLVGDVAVAVVEILGADVPLQIILADELAEVVVGILEEEGG